MENEKMEKAYKGVCQKLSGPDFRLPIKDFIDQYCMNFIDTDEVTKEMLDYHEQFKKLIKSLLSKIYEELKITENDFALIREKGIKDSNYKRYFEQIVNYNDYKYFKKIMVNRNYQIVKIIENEAQKRNMANPNRFISEGPSEEEDKKRRLEALEQQELKRAKKRSEMINDIKKNK